MELNSKGGNNLGLGQIVFCTIAFIPLSVVAPPPTTLTFQTPKSFVVLLLCKPLLGKSPMSPIHNAMWK
jgi:hypothetical protein